MKKLSDLFCGLKSWSVIHVAIFSSVALFSLFIYWLTWGTVKDFVANIDHCNLLFCDFLTFYYPMGKEIFVSEQPVRGYFYTSFFALWLSIPGLLSREGAVTFWLVFQAIVAVLLCMIPMRYFFRVPAKQAAIYCIVFLTSVPLLHNFKWGQVSVIVSLTVLIAFCLYKNNKPTLSGVFLAAAVCIKYYPIVFLIYFIIKRDMRFLAAFFVAFFVMYFVLPASFIGISNWLSFEESALQPILNSVSVANDPNSQYFSHVIGRLSHLAGFNFNGDVLKIFEGIGRVIVFLNFVLIWICVRKRLNNEIFISLSLIFVSLPFLIKTSWTHYFVFLPFCQLGLYLSISTLKQKNLITKMIGSLNYLSILLSGLLVFIHFQSWLSYAEIGSTFIASMCVQISLYGYVYLLIKEQSLQARGMIGIPSALETKSLTAL